MEAGEDWNGDGGEEHDVEARKTSSLSENRTWDCTEEDRKPDQHSSDLNMRRMIHKEAQGPVGMPMENPRDNLQNESSVDSGVAERVALNGIRAQYPTTPTVPLPQGDYYHTALGQHRKPEPIII